VDICNTIVDGEAVFSKNLLLLWGPTVGIFVILVLWGAKFWDKVSEIGRFIVKLARHEVWREIIGDQRGKRKFRQKSPTLS